MPAHKTIMNCDFVDAVRGKRLRRALKEGMKPSRWYDDNPADTGSLYRKRWTAGLDVAADIIRNSPDAALVDFAKDMVVGCKSQLPKTFAEWVKDKGIQFEARPVSSK